MSEKFADKIKKRITDLQKQQKLAGNKKPGRKIELFREDAEKDADKPVKH